MFSSSTWAPASISSAATWWVLAVVDANWKQPVSVAMPVYRQSAIWGVMVTPSPAAPGTAALLWRPHGVQQGRIRIAAIAGMVVDAQVHMAAVTGHIRFSPNSCTLATSHSYHQLRLELPWKILAAV